MNDIKTDSILNEKSVTLMLKLVGTSCNMHCQYCYEHVSSNVHTGCKDYEKIVCYLERFKDYEHVFIIFHGGEPLLLEFDLMKKLFEYIFGNFTGKCQVQIQTNGTLLDNNWIDLMKYYSPKLSLSVSLDPAGKKDLRFRNNIELRNIVLNNIKKCVGKISNIGVISVAHAYNMGDFIPFILLLRNYGVSNLTINKYQIGGDEHDVNYYILERDYVNLLKSIFVEWISRKWFEDFNIQPLMALFSNGSNKLCLYLPNENKCTCFKTFYNEFENYDICDHITDGIIPKADDKCLKCSIYKKCGGGCLIEKKDPSFCKARKELFDFIEKIKYGV